MIRFVLIFFLLMPVYGGFAQTITIEQPVAAHKGELNDKYYVPAQFDGGVSGLQSFVTGNAHFPQAGRENNIEGRVIYRFLVDEKGKLSHIEKVRSADPLLDTEAYRLIAIMPKWKPATYKKRPVRSVVVLPVNFRLQ